MAQMEYYSFERVLKELQIEEEELKRLVSEGEIRAFRDEDKMKFKKSDIEGLKKGRMTEPTIILPSGEGGDAAEDSEVLLVEEDTSETLLDIDELESAESSSASVPTVDFSSSEIEQEGPASGSGTITEELTFEEDSGSYVLESSDDVLIDSSQDLVPVKEESTASAKKKTAPSEPPSGEETFIDGDTGLQTEPLEMELDSSSDYTSVESEEEAKEGLSTQPAVEEPGVTVRQRTTMMPITVEAPASPVMVAFLVFTCVVMLFSGAIVLNTMQNTDTSLTGWLTDIMFENIFPATYVGKESQTLLEHMEWREDKREEPGKQDAKHAKKYLKS